MITTVLVNTLFEQARRLLDSSPEAADAAVQEILHLDPNHVAGRSLASQLGDRKREEFITWCLAQARRLQTDGDFAGGLAVAEQGLGSYPNETRLRQLKATLERAQQDALRQVKTLRTAAASNDSPTVLMAAPPPVVSEEK